MPPGTGYRVRPGGGAESGPLTVLSTRPAPPNTERLQPDDPLQRLRLPDHPRRHEARHLRAPADRTCERRAGRDPPPAPAGPTPTLIEYSGYGYANPAGPQSGIAILANLMGFAVVDVNMRGTGCSGGAFDFFEPLQSLDGYDVIETIARQPWVLHNKVGMMGISYGGISQLFTARPTRRASRRSRRSRCSTPPRRRSIRAASSIPALRLPGPRSAVTTPSRPDPTAGSPGPTSRSRTATQTCKANQALHGEAANLMAKIRANNHYDAGGRRPPAPITFVNKINVPVFMACQWTDEQTGGHCPDLAGTSPAPSASGSPSPTAPTSTRSTRRPTTAGTTSCSSTSRTQAPIKNPRRSTPPRRSSTRRRWGSPA